MPVDRQVHLSASPAGRGSKQSSLLLAPLLALTLLLLTGCGKSTPTVPADQVKQVYGQVVEIEGRNISEIEILKVKDDSGQVWTFTTEGFVGFTPSHLREHQLFGLPVLVSYHTKNEQLIAVDVTDYLGQ